MSSKIRTFIRLSDRIINTNMIKTIYIGQNQYNIEMVSHSGSSGFLLCGSGFIGNSDHQINIFKERSPYDYQYLSDWISREIDDIK